MKRKPQCTVSDILFYSMDGLNATYVIIRAELDQPVRKDVMAAAFARAAGRFPYFQTKLSQPDAGFELLPNENTPVLHEDPCDYVINASENDGFLYRFSALDDMVTFSFFHGITDANGAIAFLKVILTEYYRGLGEDVEPAKDIFDIDGPVSPEETVQPLDLLSDDVPSLPYAGSTFYHVPEKPCVDPDIYTFSANAPQLMQYAASYDGSPNAIASIVMAKAISELHPESLNEGIDVSISINAKPMVNAARSHWPFLQSSIFHFDEKRLQMDEELLHTYVRGKVIADCADEKLFPALAGVRTLGEIFGYMTDERARKLLCLKSTEDPRATAMVSYAGATDFGSVGRHIKGLYTFCDTPAPLLEINYNAGVFYFALSARFDAKAYAEKIREHFTDMGIDCGELQSVRLHQAQGKKDRPKMGLNLATMHLISGVRKYKGEKRK